MMRGKQFIAALVLLLGLAAVAGVAHAQDSDEQLESDQMALTPANHDPRLDDFPSAMHTPENPNPRRMRGFPSLGRPDSLVDHAVQHIVNNMVSPPPEPINDGLHPADPSNVAVGGADPNTHIRLHNNNQIKSNHDILADWDKVHEKRLKSNAEEAGKHLQEADMKTAREEQVKLKGVFHQKIHLEEQGKSFEQVLRIKTEVSRKKNRESFVKSEEEAQKSSEEARGKARLVQVEQQRFERVTKAKKQAAQRKTEILVEVRSKKNWELEEKHRAEKEHKHNIARSHHSHKLDRQAANEEFTKQQNNVKFEQSMEKKDKKAEQQKEAWRKAHDKNYERASKSAERLNKKADKARRKDSKGKWCDCRTVEVNLKTKNTWASCPKDMLMTAIIRNKKNDLRGIYRLECCHPCRADGEDLEVVECKNADWTKSFNKEGWSTCPAYSYIQGLYKSGCNKIYCIEYARCCKIAGSRGRTNCQPKKSWVKSMDKAGWSELDKNYFMAGLYRSARHMLSDIEAPMQCQYYSYN